MGEPRKNGFIAFRVNWEEYIKIEEHAEKKKQGVNEWCRNIVLSESDKALSMTAVEKILIEEIGILKFVLSRILRTQVSEEEFKKVKNFTNDYEQFGMKLIGQRFGATTEQEVNAD